MKLVGPGLICFFAGSLYGWSALIAPLQATFSVSIAQSGLVFSIATVCFTMAVLGTPHLLLRLVPKRRLAVFAISGAVSLLVASQAHSFASFLASFSIGFGTFSGAIYISSLGLAAQSSSPLVATPMMVAAFGIGGAVFGPIWRLLAETDIGLLMLWPVAGALLICAGWAWLSTTGNNAVAPPVDPGNDTVAIAPAVVLPLIWMIFALGSLGGLMVIGLAAKILDAANATLAVSSFTLAGIALGNTLGRLSVAGFTRWLHPITCVFIALTAGGAGMVLALLDAPSITLAAGLCLIAAGYGVLASAIPTLTGAIYGAAMFQRRFAVVFTAWGVAGFVAPLATGAIFDTTGSFDFAVYLAFAATLLALLLVTALRLGMRSVD